MDEYAEINKKYGITVKRAPVIFADEVQPETPKPQVSKPRKAKVSKYAMETPEETKERKRQVALDWYNKRKEDVKLKAERKAYANAYYAKKRAEKAALRDSMNK